MENAQLLAVAARLRGLSAEMPLLPGIAARPVCWWVPDRDEARELLRQQIGGSGKCRVLAGTHANILHEPALHEAVAAAVAAELEPA